jgi:zinc transport system ATP-binding protein
MISLEHIYFSYTKRAPWLLDDICLHVPKGAYISIVGTNGSGKTTLLRLILGFLKPSKGTIDINARRVGYVSQNQLLDRSFPITVEEVIHSYGRILHLSHISAKEALSQTGMESFAKRRMGSLSGGQQQKVLIARALMGKPDLLILDEPSTGVDIQSQREIYSSLSRLNKEKGLTILSVEHNLHEAGRVSTMLYHVHEGRGHLCTVEQYVNEYLKEEGCGLV